MFRENIDVCRSNISVYRTRKTYLIIDIIKHQDPLWPRNSIFSYFLIFYIDIKWKHYILRFVRFFLFYNFQRKLVKSKKKTIFQKSL